MDRPPEPQGVDEAALIVVAGSNLGPATDDLHGKRKKIKAARAARGAVKAAKAAIKDWSDEQAKRESVVATKSKRKSKKELLSILKGNPDLCPGLLHYAKFLRYEKEQKSASTQHGPSHVEQQVVASPPTKKRRRGGEVVKARTIPENRKRAQEEQPAASEPTDGGRSIAKVEDQRPRVRHGEDTGAALTLTEDEVKEEQKHPAVSNPKDCGVLTGAAGTASVDATSRAAEEAKYQHSLELALSASPNSGLSPELREVMPDPKSTSTRPSDFCNPLTGGDTKKDGDISETSSEVLLKQVTAIDKEDGIPKQAIHIYLGVSGY